MAPPGAERGGAHSRACSGVDLNALARLVARSLADVEQPQASDARAVGRVVSGRWRVVCSGAGHYLSCFGKSQVECGPMWWGVARVSEIGNGQPDFSIPLHSRMCHRPVSTLWSVMGRGCLVASRREFHASGG
jgi:hypothetical protein